MNQQLTLNLEEPIYPRFDQLLGTENAELIHILQHENNQFVYIWGEESTGKSHILQSWVGIALQKGADAIYIDAPNMTLSDMVFDADCVAIDQLETLNLSEQSTLFNLFNHFLNQRSGNLLISANVPPPLLTLREDLRTRMEFCLVYEVKPLSDQEKINALTSMAHSRHIAIEPKIFRYLIEHWKRDMGDLMQMFDDLVAYSIVLGKPITLPLVKQLLKKDFSDDF